MAWILLGLITAGAVSLFIFLRDASFGRRPSGARLERIKKSPHYVKGKFENLSPTPQLTTEQPKVLMFLDFIFRKKTELSPMQPLPVIQTDLSQLDRNKDLLIWFGHSSYFIQVDGRRIIVDPVFDRASPVRFFNKPFKGPDVFRAADLPDPDYLVITHDHWDHLDYKTVTSLARRTRKIIAALGVGESLEYWGVDKNKIVELDWNESATLENGFEIFCLPARHFSGRGLVPNQTLWASFLLQSPSSKIYMGGDSGFDSHFADICKKFPGIDLAILENGQYDKNWRYIHLMPEQLATAAKDLGAKKVLTVHHSKYALANHPWYEPLNNALALREKEGLDVLLPRLGEIVNYKDSTHHQAPWWKNIQ